MKLPRFTRSQTGWSLAALAAGFLLGAIDKATGASGFNALAAVLEPLGSLWLSALQMTVMPLVLVLILAAFATTSGTSIGGLTARTLLLFVAMMIGAAIFTLLVTPPFLESVRVSPETLASLRGAELPASSAAASASASESFGDWVAGLLPTNLFAAMAAGEILPLLIFAGLLGLAITLLPTAQREPLTHGISGLAAAMLTLVRWILWLTPVGVFGLAFLYARETGVQMLGFVGAFVVGVCVLLVAATLLLYPITVFFGRVPLGRFARATAPAQVVALGTRSSIASLPALVQGANDHLRLPPPATGLVLPLSVSVFKFNRLISSPFKLLFLAHLFDVPLTTTTIVTFILTIILLSFTSPGVPGGAPGTSLPAYLVIGIPIEGLMILEAVEVIPDIFKTMLNVTADMSAATIVSRSSRAASAAEPTLEPAPAA